MSSYIFEAGILKFAHLNPNYRGLKGWPCKIGGKDEELIAVFNGVYQTKTRHSNIMPEISWFTNLQIPEGELVWMQDIFWGWHLLPFGGVSTSDTSYMSSNCDGKYYTRMVPYLIAETAADAQELVDWI